MITWNNLYPQIYTYSNLWQAWKKAKKGRSGKQYVQQFDFNVEKELIELHQQLKNKTYSPGGYTEFRIYVPKERKISAAPFRDRVVHHALCSIIGPLFEKKFIFDSYANREGKGTLRAIERFQCYASRYTHVLKCDIKKYFPSIDHEILKQQIRKTIYCKDTLWLIDRIIDNSNLQDNAFAYFDGDTLFTPHQRRKGLPIGNLTSQFFANVYLNPFDHYISEKLRAVPYIRYVDDFVIFGNDKHALGETLRQIRDYLQNVRLILNDEKSFARKCSAGVQFLGMRIFPRHRLLVNKSLVRFRRRMKLRKEEYANGALTVQQLRSSIHGWLGHAMHSNSKHICSELFINLSFVKGNIC